MKREAGGNSYECKDTWVPGAGYSPGAFQRRILCLLKDSLQLLTVRIDDGIHHDGCRIMSNIAGLKCSWCCTYLLGRLAVFTWP
jgi:hypothetical protein